MRRSDRWSEGPRIEMLPLIDVMFLLLVTFVYAMTAMIRSTAIPVNLPQLGTAQSQSLSSVLVVTVERDGSLFAGGQPVDGPGLIQTVRELHEQDDEFAVLLNADADARHGAVAAALDGLRAAGQQRIYLAGVEGGE
ncbi:MAG: biopolymer transporter ExbD [Planctomycetes bacterium]|nr:biopolymer transporter ExbD [Planctomycetota bacterium]MCB9909074.1 biopolymer transporter ExbD [Planctomycetota bacterium]MCB9911679.1 biopolymer transporter ExbD [Planctomycetota bacterium]HPF13376.1 biopolymer transporter ExbD [Planctomycetota bacterium]HRV80975.1 biopolymer transporter ExbD [Planctomycetota bacterium]